MRSPPGLAAVTWGLGRLGPPPGAWAFVNDVVGPGQHLAGQVADLVEPLVPSAAPGRRPGGAALSDVPLTFRAWGLAQLRRPWVRLVAELRQACGVRDAVPQGCCQLGNVIEGLEPGPEGAAGPPGGRPGAVRLVPRRPGLGRLGLEANVTDETPAWGLPGAAWTAWRGPGAAFRGLARASSELPGAWPASWGPGGQLAARPQGLLRSSQGASRGPRNVTGRAFRGLLRAWSQLGLGAGDQAEDELPGACFVIEGAPGQLTLELALELVPGPGRAQSSSPPGSLMFTQGAWCLAWASCLGLGKAHQGSALSP